MTMNDRLRQLMALGREHYLAGDYDQAERCLSEVLREHDGFADLSNMLGVICHSQGRFEEAEKHFERALDINPSYTEAALNLSVTYNDRGKYQEARTVYTQAMNNSYDGETQSLDPFARGKIANMHAALGEAYTGLGLYDSAVRELERALDLCPGFVDLRTRLGNVYRDVGRYEDALAEFRQVKKTKPDYIPARLALGVTLYSLGRREEAVSEWQEVVSIAPSDRRAAIYLRMVSDQEHAPEPGSALEGDGTPGDSSEHA